MFGALGLKASGTVTAAASGPTIVQQGLGDGYNGKIASIAFSIAPAVGNTVVAMYLSSNTGLPTPNAGWTEGDSATGGGYCVTLFTHTVASGDGTTFTPTNSNAGTICLGAWEVSGSMAVSLANSGTLTAGTDALTLLGGSAPSKAAIPVTAFVFTGASPTATFVWPAGWTGIGPNKITGFPYYGGGAAFAAATSSAVAAPAVTWTGTRGNGVAVVCGLAYITGP